MAQSNRIVKLKLDVIFKAMFGRKENEHLLADFLSRLLEIPRSSIKQIIMDNVELIPDHIANKFSRVDLKMQVDERIVNVEMQISDEPSFRERTLFYWSKIYSDELKSGEDYSQLRETICINIVNFNLFDCPDYHSHFKVMEKNRHEVLSDRFAIHFFELKKIGKHPDKDKPLELWLQLINAETEEELQMLEQTNVQEISQAILVLRELSADEKMRYMADMREKALHDEATAIHAALEQGMAQGLEQGMARGMKKGLEQGIAQGLAQGMAQGLEQGMAQGMAQGLEQGMAQGMAQGLEQGMAQGMEKGKVEERQRIIENLRKFGLSEEQIQTALRAQEHS